MWKGFRAFIARGNVLDLAIAVVVGAAFATVIKSLVDDIIMPPLGMALGKVDFTNIFFVVSEGAKIPGPYATLADAKAAGAVTINYGLFLNSVVAFLLVGFACYQVVHHTRRFWEAPAAAPDTKPCSFCAMAIPIPATRCPHCTSQLQG
jgi:large conductance mechanosensitive channel